MTDNVTFTLHEKWVEDCSSFVAQFPLTHICAVCDCDAIIGKKEEAFFFFKTIKRVNGELFLNNSITIS